MKVHEAMHRDVQLASPGQTIREAAAMMAAIDSGVLPVGDGDRLVGMITDRDIAIRGVARGLSPDAAVREVMSPEVKYCFENDEIDDVAQNMADLQIRRLPVVSQDKQLVGIVSICDIAKTCSPDTTGVAISGISKPGGPHSQSSDAISSQPTG